MANRFENKVRIIELLRERGLTSRPELAEILNINLPTISNLTKELFDERLIRCDGFGESDGGRRAELLAINPGYATAIGLELSLYGVHGVLADLGGNVLDREPGPTEVPTEPEEMVDAVMAVGEALLSRSLSDRRPVGVGLGVAGLADESGRVSRRFPHRDDWDDMPLAERLEKRLNLPALLDNDVQAAALAEKRYGTARGVHNFLYVHIGHGIACGIMVSGKLYTGATRNAGEFGHTIIDPSGPICYCGNYGCLESLASPPAILDQTLQAIRKGVQSSVATRARGDLSTVKVDSIFQAADAGDRLATNVVTRAAEYIGWSLANLVNVFNPEMLVFGGGILVSGFKAFNEAIERTFRSRVLPILQQDTQVRLSSLGRDAAALGGASVVFEDLFERPKALISLAHGFQPTPEYRDPEAAEERAKRRRTTRRLESSPLGDK
jgi:predicted NBD/HSP70 family sugar kinase